MELCLGREGGSSDKKKPNKNFKFDYVESS